MEERSAEWEKVEFETAHYLLIKMKHFTANIVSCTIISAVLCSLFQALKSLHIETNHL